MSGVGVTQEGSEEREYLLQLFYIPKSNSQYAIHVVITWNTESHITVSTLI